MKPPPDPLHILHSPCGSVTALTYIDGDCEKLVSGSENGDITIWNLNTFRPIKTWKAHPAPIVWLGNLVDNHQLISHGRTSSVKIWNDENELMHEIPVDHEGFCKCDVQNNALCIPSGKNEIHVIAVNAEMNKTSTHTLINDEGSIMAVQFVGNSLVAAYENGFICIWSREDKSTFSHSHRIQAMPMCLSFDPKHGRILLGTSCETLYIFDEDLHIQREILLTNAGLSCISIRCDDRIYATSGWDKRIRVFSLKHHKKLCVLQLHDETVNSVQFTKKNSILAAASSDGQISLWNLYP